MKKQPKPMPALIPAQSGGPLVLTVEQVADRLQIPKSSIYERTRFRGCNVLAPLPCRRIGRYLRFIASEVDEWLLGLPHVSNKKRRPYRRKVAA
jgi:predicted DNA-binding transcriptional regulator AlpA